MVFENKLFWVHWMGRVVPENTMEELIRNVKRRTPNINGIAIKTSDGQFWQGRYDGDNDMAINGKDDVERWARQLARNGLQTYVWTVVRGEDIATEARITVEAARARGVRALILDVEGGPLYFGGRTAEDARSLINRIHNATPNDMHIALNFDARGTHPQTIHIDEWLPFVDSLHPMVYHWHFSEGTREPRPYLEEAFRVCRQWNLPIVPMLQTYPDPASNTQPPEEHIYDGTIYSFQLGAEGVSYFRLGSEDEEHHDAISRIDTSNIPDDTFNNTNTRTFVVSTLLLNVRSQPEVDARTLLSGEQLQIGERVEVRSNSRLEREGFVWWQHSTGWSAEKRSDDSEVYMVDAESDLPPPDFQFVRSPVDLDDMQWFYYYGNTIFAFRYGRTHNYHGYSQGLHGGLDYGHPGGIPIVAGVNGVFDYSGSGRAFGPNRVDVLVGNYRIIYGHVARPISMQRGARVTPDTVIGFMDSGAQHMHLEVRYQNDSFLINPLLFIPEDQQNKIFSDFPPEGPFAFYSSTRWQRWLTPFDQPTIIRGGPVIGPTA